MLAVLEVQSTSIETPASGPLTVAAHGDPTDPLETINRSSFRLNSAIDKAAVRPLVSTYQRVVPGPVQSGIHNFIDNWNEPVVILNDGLQLNLPSTGSACLRFSINTTIGVLGLFDVASRLGIDHHDNAFALTLGRYGVASGPYLYFPIFGPSSVRDATGTVVDFLTNPITQVRHIKSESVEVAQEIATSVDSPVESLIAAVDGRASHDGVLRDLEDTSTDPYAALRTAYLQHMASEMSGNIINLDQSPEIAETPAPAQSTRTDATDLRIKDALQTPPR